MPVREHKRESERERKRKGEREKVSERERDGYCLCETDLLLVPDRLTGTVINGSACFIVASEALLIVIRSSN